MQIEHLNGKKVFPVGAVPIREKCTTIAVTVFSRRFILLSAFFCRRFSSEKCPTLTVASFFSFFFSSDYNLTLIGPLFLQSKLLKLLA